MEDTRHLMPRANDPPFRWIPATAYSLGQDGKPITGLDRTGTAHLLAGKTGQNRAMLDIAARKICEAARIDLSWRGDWWILVGWLNEGFDVNDQIVPAITALVERRVKSPKGYQRPSTLRYFDAAIREYIAAHREAA